MCQRSSRCNVAVQEEEKKEQKDSTVTGWGSMRNRRNMMVPRCAYKIQRGPVIDMPEKPTVAVAEISE